MSTEKNSHHHKEPNRYTLVLVPSDQSKKTKSFSFGMVGATSIAAAMVVVIIGLTLTVLIYTPVGPLLPIPNPELERLYGKKIVEIQEQVNALLNEMVQLRQYNLHLRRALGENISVDDSTAMIQRGVYHSRPTTTMATDTAKRFQQTQRLNETGLSVNRTSEIFRTQEQRVSRPEQIGDETYPLLTPAVGYFTRGFEPENNHFGVDIAGKEGTLIVAAAPGKVLFADWTHDDGFKIILAHSSGYVTVYKHNQQLLRSVAAVVKRGEPIALMGSTGRTSSGPHLHFEVWKDGVTHNPANYLVTVQ